MAIADKGITDLIKGAPVVGPEDTLRRAAGLLNGTEGSTLIVISHGQIVGTVSERAMAAALASSDDPEGDLDRAVDYLIQPGLTYVNAGVTVREAAGVFASTDVDMLPVIDNYGSYKGVVYRSDLVGYMTRTLKMPPIAGLATPLGVRLTTGSVSGGAGRLGAFLAGVSLATMILAAQALVALAMSGIERITGLPITTLLASPPISVPNILDLPFYVSVVSTLILFGLMMRLSPLAGYHAAEHMTVHAIEAGEELTVENVRSMPRVHPRCGTNILAAAGMFTILVINTGSELAVLVAIFVVILGWRTVGGWLQYMVTTKDPSAKQLANGVAAGREIIERFHEAPNYQAQGFERIRNLGLLHTAAGTATVFCLLAIIQGMVHIPWLM